MTVKELNDVLAKERKLYLKGKDIDGPFGINACKDSVEYKLISGKSLKQIYIELVNRALKDEPGFNHTMIFACELMMEEAR